jgi:hypothetical protein
MIDRRAKKTLRQVGSQSFEGNRPIETGAGSWNPIAPNSPTCPRVNWRLRQELEEAMHKSRYVVMQKDGEWQIKSAYRQVTSTFPSKAQALCAAIELAEKDGNRGHAPEVLVRHEDDRFITEWVYGEDLHPDDASRPAGSKQPGRSGA